MLSHELILYMTVESLWSYRWILTSLAHQDINVSKHGGLAQSCNDSRRVEEAVKLISCSVCDLCTAMHKYRGFGGDWDSINHTLTAALELSARKINRKTPSRWQPWALRLPGCKSCRVIMEGLTIIAQSLPVQSPHDIKTGVRGNQKGSVCPEFVPFYLIFLSNMIIRTFMTWKAASLLLYKIYKINIAQNY